MPYYAVYKGFKPGIYDNWNECNNQITGFSKPVFKKFILKKDAELFIQTGGIHTFKKHTHQKKKKIEDFFNVLPQDNIHNMFNMDSNIDTIMGNKQNNMDSIDKNVLYVYTDGSCYGNGKKISFGGAGIYFGPNDERNTSLPISNSTNNIAELCAINKALEIIKENIENGEQIMIMSDSRYSIRCFTDWGDKCHKKNWKDKTKPQGKIVNMGFFKDAYYYLKKYPNVKFHHIRAHTNLQDEHSLGNEHADILADKGTLLDIEESTLDTLGSCVFPFGQYKRKKIIEVYLLDKQYVTWAYKNCKPNVALFKHILKSFLDKMI